MALPYTSRPQPAVYFFYLATKFHLTPLLLLLISKSLCPRVRLLDAIKPFWLNGSRFPIDDNETGWRISPVLYNDVSTPWHWCRAKWSKRAVGHLQRAYLCCCCMEKVVFWYLIKYSFSFCSKCLLHDKILFICPTIQDYFQNISYQRCEQCDTFSA